MTHNNQRKAAELKAMVTEVTMPLMCYPAVISG
jgi:hypothetical protein